MAAPPNFEEGQSTYRPPRFNGQYYGWWKTCMHDFMMVEDSELWDIICDGPHVPMKKLEETGPIVPKGRKEYSDIDRKAIEKNYRAQKILMCGIGPDKYNRVSACDTAKEIWEALQIAHTKELLRFTSIINELHSLGNVIPRNKLVRKILSILSGSWESKTYEIKRKKDSERREPKKEKNLLLKAESSDSSNEDSDMPILLRDFKRWFEEMVVYQSGAVQEQYKQNPDKAAKRNLVPDKRFNRKSATNNIVKQALAAWGDSSSESEREPNAENSSMMAVETEAMKYDSLFARMAQSDDDEEDEDDEEALNERITSVENERDDLMVVVIDLQETIEGLSNEKHTLEGKIATTEEERDDLLVICTDLEEIIEGL
ncbi:uncharacterized protein [Nicotiana sylvestris]|uniref:uncharacterized protein n=1 Tax=Nicotiana sylvestris TaxID=4096 RepID=UPI00388C51AF